jgi:pimeloyl-ACP methyl ester carboxylesterase
MASTARGYWTLARWLGPWASDTARPPGVDRRAIQIDGDRSFEAWVYAPAGRAPIGAYVIAPGLHYAGPADPRLDRFCAILAASGILVLAPFLPDYTALRVEPTALGDLDRAFDALLALPELPAGVRPGVFSISFGSLLALRLAALPARADRIGALVLFGGYADWAATIRFCLTGEIDGVRHTAHDPLNQPVVLMNLLEFMSDRPADEATLIAAWRRYVEATWGRPEMKVDGRWQAVARDILPGVPAELREWFAIGVGLEPGALERCDDALAHFGGPRAAFLDPLPHLGGIRCPVHLVHGVDDDVIPYPQSQKLAAALAPHVDARVYLTGLYGHTAKSGIGGRLRDAPAMAREMWTMIRMLNVMIGAARVRG